MGDQSDERVPDITIFILTISTQTDNKYQVANPRSGPYLPIYSVHTDSLFLLYSPILLRSISHPIPYIRLISSLHIHKYDMSKFEKPLPL